MITILAGALLGVLLSRLLVWLDGYNDRVKIQNAVKILLPLFAGDIRLGILNRNPKIPEFRYNMIMNWYDMVYKNPKLLHMVNELVDMYICLICNVYDNDNQKKESDIIKLGGYSKVFHGSVL